MDEILRVVVTLICLGLVVVIHEYGHLLMAKWFRVRIERFTVGFGPEIVGWTAKDNIRYSICAVPLGGMVKMAGEYIEERTNDPAEFFAKPWWQRTIIALAGPAMNYLLAFVLFAFVAAVWGILQPSKDAIVGDIVAGLPAAASQLKSGDKVLTVDGKAVSSWEEMAGAIHDKPGKTVTLGVERMDTAIKAVSKVDVLIVPQKDAASGLGLIGILPQVTKVKPGFVGSFQAAWSDIQAWTMQPLRYIVTQIRRLEGPKELSGPLGIARMVSKATKEGIAYVIYLIAIISTGLGLFNLFPIPVLDGGHIFLYLIEAVRRRPMSARALQWANLAGLSVVLMIFLYASYQDYLRMHLGK
jgi:regulator of sigma E protease